MDMTMKFEELSCKEMHAVDGGGWSAVGQITVGSMGIFAGIATGSLPLGLAGVYTIGNGVNSTSLILG